MTTMMQEHSSLLLTLSHSYANYNNTQGCRTTSPDLLPDNDHVHTVSCVMRMAHCPCDNYLGPEPLCDDHNACTQSMLVSSHTQSRHPQMTMRPHPKMITRPHAQMMRP